MLWDHVDLDVGIVTGFALLFTWALPALAWKKEDAVQASAIACLSWAPCGHARLNF